MMEKVCRESGKVFISPYDHPDVIAGQVSSLMSSVLSYIIMSRNNLYNFILPCYCIYFMQQCRPNVTFLIHVYYVWSMRYEGLISIGISIIELS